MKKKTEIKQYANQSGGKMYTSLPRLAPSSLTLDSSPYSRPMLYRYPTTSAAAPTTTTSATSLVNDPRLYSVRLPVITSSPSESLFAYNKLMTSNSNGMQPKLTALSPTPVIDNLEKLAALASNRTDFKPVAGN